MTFVIKNLVMGDTLLVHGLAIEDKNIQSLEIKVNDFVKPKVAMDDFDNLYRDLDNLMKKFKSGIITKFFPSTSTTQETTPTSETQRTTSTSRTADRPPGYDPLRIPNSGGYGRAPPMQPQYDPFGGGYGMPSNVPYFGIGSGDLNALPSPFTPFGGGNSGNLVGPDHPGFGNLQDPYSLGRGRGGRGRGGHPPGARYDPYGPPGFPEPDFDDLPPPGFDNSLL